MGKIYTASQKLAGNVGPGGISSSMPWVDPWVYNQMLNTAVAGKMTHAKLEESRGGGIRV